MAKVKDHLDPTKEIDTETCEHCKKNPGVRKADNTLMSSQELCAQMGICSASIDWEEIYNRNAMINKIANVTFGKTPANPVESTE